MIDLHIHILPGADDGAQDYEESIGMAEHLWNCGIRTICATPHANQRGRYENYYSSEFSRRYVRLEEMLRSYNLPIRILEGQEIMASEDMIRKIRDGELISLNNTQYYLVEFPFESNPNWIADRLEEVIRFGATPLVAHVERYLCVQFDPRYVYDWIQMGCATQMNKGSILGRFGQRVQQVCVPLLNFELIHCFASDAHGPIRRTPWMLDAYELIAKSFDTDYADRLFDRNPKRILSGKTIRSYARNPSYYI